MLNAKLLFCITDLL